MTLVHTHARVTPSTRIRRAHPVPSGSTPRVLTGQIVKATDTLAVAEVASEHRMIELAAELGVEPAELAPLLKVEPGERVVAGDVLASRRGFLGFGERQVEAPVDGRVLRIENGQLLLEGERIRIEVEATVPGQVISVAPEEPIVVETTAAAVELAWGQGGLTWGALRVMDDIPSLQTSIDRFNIDHRGALVVIGSPLTEPFLRAAANIGVKGVIAASVSASLLPLLADLEFPVGVTQGFGQLTMSREVLDLLRKYNGSEAVLDTAKSSDWRERRPEIIIPVGSQQRASAREERGRRPSLQVGDRVRVLQAPYLGRIGIIMGLPDEPRRLPSGLWASGVTVEIENSEPGRGVFVPFANLEQLD